LGEELQPRRATPDQLDRVCHTLALAFATEPMSTWPFENLADPAKAIEDSFRRWDADNIELGIVYEIADAAGAAVWVPPELADRWTELERLARPDIYALTADNGRRFERMWDWVEAHEPTEPVWHLDRVGVDPARQGQGLGTALIAYGLNLAADAGVPAFLETATERNVAMYASMGFRVYDHGTTPDGGPNIWFMRFDTPSQSIFVK
jgi:GNAT superfamily N-acetyltransferase